MEINKVVIIGNGFDLAHGLKTSYKNFLDWYMCKVFNEYKLKNNYYDPLVSIEQKNTGIKSAFDNEIHTAEDVLDLIQSNINQTINFKSSFFNRVVNSFKANTWVDIEREYFRFLKAYFSNNNFADKAKMVDQLNSEFDFLIEQLAAYITQVNTYIAHIPKLETNNSNFGFNHLFSTSNESIRVINFNYTETLYFKRYVKQENIIHIHGRVAEMDINPVIFGYGDESDPVYQDIEDSGENRYLEHIKSFGYFKTENYHRLLSYIDSDLYCVYIVGHSCGLSDRVLLNEIFEHKNCQNIDIFYHLRKDGTDNFKEITQEISRHFKPHNKNVMRRRIANKNPKNIIPQNISFNS